jgi:hypothetical protein
MSTARRVAAYAELQESVPGLRVISPALLMPQRSSSALRLPSFLLVVDDFHETE